MFALRKRALSGALGAKSMVEWLKSEKGWRVCLIAGLAVYIINRVLGIIPVRPGEAICEQKAYEVVTDQRTGKQVYHEKTEMRSIVPEQPSDEIAPLPHAKGPRILSRHTHQTWPKVKIKSPLAWYFYLRIDQLVWLASVAATIWGIYCLGHYLYRRYEIRRKIEEARDRDAMRRDV